MEPVAFLAGKLGKCKTICALVAHADYFPPKFSTYGFQKYDCTKVFFFFLLLGKEIKSRRTDS